jgi:hypothetical protein
MKIQAGSFLPKPLEAIGRQLGVEHRVLDVAMPEIVLDGTGIVTIIGELEPAGMAQHMGMHRKGEGGELAGAGEYSPDRRGAQGPALLGDKHLRCPRVVPLQAPQRPKLGAPQGVGRGGATLLAIDMQQPLGEVDLRPSEVHELRDPQSMPVGEEQEGGIPVAVAPANPAIFDGWGKIKGVSIRRILTLEKK